MSLLSALFLIALLSLPGHAVAYGGRVLDAATGKPIEGALVTSGETVVRTDKNGAFRLNGAGDRIGFRAHGYRRGEVAAGLLENGEQDIELAPFSPKALYLSFWGIGNKWLRSAALELIDQTELNALVIDVKGDLGMISYRSSVPLAAEVDAQRITTIRDIRGLIASLREKGIYTIARIVVFKDSPLALSRPDLAVKTPDGRIWRDREELAWVDPFKKETWDYNIAIAVEAARNGFDEIQFDYVRFPDERGLVYSRPNTEENRIAAITGFLAEARRRLAPHNVFVAADIFGYICWNPDDTGIGQKLEELAPHLDYISPMLYPSGFHYGIPGYRLPVAHPYEIVYLSLKKAQDRTGLPAVRFRPWLQAFRDYAFDRRPFTAKEIEAQIRAAETFGAHGWMLWNAGNIYSRDGLRP